MSQPIDYSKFENIDSDMDDDDDDKKVSKQTSASTTSTSSPKVPSTNINIGRATMKEKDSQSNRYIFEFNGQKIYEWDQNLEEVNIYIDAPPGIPARNFDIIIEPMRLRVGLKGHDRHFIDETTFGKVQKSESSWYLDEGVIHIILLKVERGSVWEVPLMGREGIKTSQTREGNGYQIDPSTKEKMTKELMLERFQEENPGFDFRDAEFNGEVPDPRSFMGGISHD
mmetsp:Transcript_14453/g.17570  ORF Transcript_14453/g.17570 Transcript_14453/m.17570 type:complete len:226 (+) Transcript_14453:135-812(+)